MDRYAVLVVALPLVLLACGNPDEGVVDPNLADAGVDPLAAERDPDPTTPDDPSDVPLTDEELEYGTEGAENDTPEGVAAGAASSEGFAEATDANGIAGASSHPNLDPQHVVPSNLKSSALAYLDANKSKFPNQSYLTLIDMSQASGKERMYVIDLRSGAVTKTVVAHGSGSDPSNSGTPSRFSNTNNSKMTSLGFYKTGELYQGSHVGHAMRLDGLQSTNSHARARGVVMHGSSYVSRGRAKQGRSWGCTAVPSNEVEGLIDKLKGGSLLLVAHGVTAADGCDGKSDGYYCSTISNDSAYNCRNGARAGAATCARTSQTCKAGSDGKAQLSGGALGCQ